MQPASDSFVLDKLASYKNTVKKTTCYEKNDIKIFFSENKPPPKNPFSTCYEQNMGKCQNKGKNPYIMAESPTLISINNIKCKKKQKKISLSSS